ncbi:MAG: hypothetical protein IPL39_16275 [Opitutaceae bacterium]|nr:hypothetical protein [Opitutaceae bacterium]
MTTPGQAKSATVHLDQERTITYNERAEFRMGSLDRPFTVADLRARRRSWAALVAWTWACLSEQDAADFASPESLAPHIQGEATVKAVFEAFLDCYIAGQEPASKNAAG